MLKSGLAICAAAMGLLFASALVPARAQSKPDLNIGVVASLSGGFVSAAHDTMSGFEAWQKARGLPGGKLTVQTLDDETTPVGAVNAFRKLASDPKISLIYLFINSSSALAVKSLASEYKVPIISGGAADAIGIPPDPYLFKVAPAVRDFMIVLASYAKKKGWKRVALLNMTDAFGQTEAKNFRELAPEYGLEIVAAETLGVEDTNFNSQLTRIRAARPDVIYNGASSRAAILTYKQIKQLGLTTPIVVTQAAISKSFYDAIGGPAAADGLLVPVQLGSFGEAAGGDTARLYKELQSAMGSTVVYFATFGFDVGILTEAAYRNSDGTRAGLRDALEAVKDLPGVNGPMTYSPTDHTGQNFRSIGMGKLENGVAIPAE